MKGQEKKKMQKANDNANRKPRKKLESLCKGKKYTNTGSSWVS